MSILFPHTFAGKLRTSCDVVDMCPQISLRTRPLAQVRVLLTASSQLVQVYNGNYPLCTLAGVNYTWWVACRSHVTRFTSRWFLLFSVSMSALVLRILDLELLANLVSVYVYLGVHVKVYMPGYTCDGVYVKMCMCVHVEEGVHVNA